MEKEDRSDKGLKEIDEVITPLKMRRFMEHNGALLVGVGPSFQCSQATGPLDGRSLPALVREPPRNTQREHEAQRLARSQQLHEGDETEDMSVPAR
jgi:hypothetical protein